MIHVLEIKRCQNFRVLTAATYVVFFLRSLMYWCFYVLILYSMPVPVWLSMWFLPLEQVLFVSIQAPAIRYAYRLHSRYDFSIFRLIVTPLQLTHWGRVTHICVGKLTIIGADNGLSPGRLQAIIWTNAGMLLIGPLGTNFSEILIAIETFSFNKMHLKISSAKWRPFCLGLNVLKQISEQTDTLSCHLSHLLCNVQTI